MKRKTKTLLSFFMVVALLAVMVGGPLVNRADAGNISYAYFAPSRMQISQTGGVEWYLAINFPTANMTDPTVTIDFPSGDTGWCTTVGTDLVVTNEGSAPVDIGPSWDATAHGSATFSNAGCNTTGTHTITFDTTGTFNFGTTYGFKIVEAGTPTADLGTDDTVGSHAVSVQIDDGGVSHTTTVGVPLVTDDTVNITADVEAAPSVVCTLSSVSEDFGILYQNGAYSTVSHTIQADPSTNADGYYWMVYGLNAGLQKAAGDLIASAATTVDLTAGEGFGLDASDPDAGSSAVVATNFITTDTAGVFGGIQAGISNAKLLISDINSGDGVADTSTITYGARAVAASATTDYDEEVTFVCGGYY